MQRAIYYSSKSLSFSHLFEKSEAGSFPEEKEVKVEEKLFSSYFMA